MPADVDSMMLLQSKARARCTQRAASSLCKPCWLMDSLQRALSQMRHTNTWLQSLLEGMQGMVPAHLGMRAMILARTPVREMAMKIQPSMNTAVMAVW